jgi:hypothetical protein
MSNDFEFLNDKRAERAASAALADAPEITPEEYAEHTANRVASALESTRLFEVVEVKAGIGQVHVLGRVAKDKERSFVSLVVAPILAVLDQKKDDCQGFVGKQFMLKYGTVKYAWVISFAASDLTSASSEICASFDSAVPRVEVSEAPLGGRGAPQSGGRQTGRRGASALS